MHNNQQASPQPLMMVAPFDPVEALLTDLIEEIQAGIAGQDDAKFWDLVRVHFMETSIFSFDTSYQALIEGIQSSREQSDYFVRFCARMTAKAYYKPAMEVIFKSFGDQCKWFDCVSETILASYVNDDVAKILIMVSVYKPQIVSMLVGGK